MLVLPPHWINNRQEKDVYSRLFALDGTVYRLKDGRKTIRFTRDGKHYFAKLYYGIGWKRLVKYIFQMRLPVLSAQIEWESIQRLNNLGIKTLQIVGYGKRGWNPAKLQSFIITKELSNSISLEDFCRTWPTDPVSPLLKRTMIRQIARITRILHENGMCHRDYYICHFLLDISKGKDRLDYQHLQLYLIDLHRVTLRRRISRRSRIKDLGALYFSCMDIGLSRRDLMRFIQIYRDQPLRAVMMRETAFWLQVKRRGHSLYRKIFQKNPENMCKF